MPSPPPPPPQGAEGIAKEVAQLREAAQNEMLLNEESSPTAVIDELQHLLAKLHVHEEELARINKYQALFKVGHGLRAHACTCGGSIKA